MPIPVICPCSAKLRVADHLRGLHIKCPRCGAFHAVKAVNGHAATAHPGASQDEDPCEQAPATTEAVLSASVLSEEERETLLDVLEKGEQVVWADKPDANAAFRFAWIFTAGLGLFAFLFLVIVVCMLTLGRADIVMYGIAVVLVLLALAMAAVAVAAPFVQRWRFSQAVYAVTNQRALTWKCDFLGRIKLQAYSPASLGSMRLLGGASGMGSLWFGTQQIKQKSGRVTGIVIHGFFYIQNAAAVEKLIRERLIDPFMDKVYDDNEK
jgi:hypothetical protein